MKNNIAMEILHSYILDDSSDSLSHHGIKNMHWGVKNGPPYPLDKKVSARIKKGKNERARYSKKELEDMRKNPNARKYRKQKVGINQVFGRKGLASGLNYFKYVEGFGQKKPMNVATLIDSGQGDAVRRLDRPGHKVVMEDVKKCNRANHGDYRVERTNNCALCASTMFLRGLGYDVTAGVASRGTNNAYADYWFDGTRSYKQKGAANMYQQMASFGNQGRGVLNIRHRNGSGHAVYFQNERGEDGKFRPIIYDGQIGKRYDKFSDFLKSEKIDQSQFSTISRLDIATPNWKHLAEDGVCNVPSETVPVVDRRLTTGEYLGRMDSDWANRHPIQSYEGYGQDGSERALERAYRRQTLMPYK